MRLWPLPSSSSSRRVAVLAGVAVAVVAILAVLGFSEGEAPAAASRPVVTAEDGPCVKPAPEMRRLHKHLLLDERVMAVRHGVRDPELRMQRCVSCHAVADEAGQPVGYTDDRHFCRACHAEVAVTLDCFSCHRSTPDVVAQAEGTR